MASQFTGNLKDENFAQFLIDYNSRSGLTFGIPFLDKMIRCRPGHIIAIGGRPGEGKSMLAIQFMHEFALAGKKVVYFSNEMPKGEIIGRLVSRVLQYDSEDVFDNRLGDRAEAVSLCVDDIKNWPIRIYDNLEGCDVKKITEILERDRPDMFFLDHLQHVRKEDKYTPKHESLESAVAEIKRIVTDQKNTAFILSQCNRNSINRKHFIPDVADLKGSGAIEENANTILLLTWPYSHQIHHSPEGNSSYAPNEYFIDIAKNRGGRVALCKGVIHPHFQQITGREQ